MVAQDVDSEPSTSQGHKIKLSFQYGLFNAHNRVYENIQPGKSIGGDISYFVTNRFFITAHINYGSNYYYEDSYSNDPDLWHFDNRTNAVVVHNNIGLMVGYQQPITRWLNVSAQAGIGQFIEIRKDFPFVLVFPGSGSAPRYYVSTEHFDFSIPLKLNISFPVKNQYIEPSISFGCYVVPDYLPFFSGLYIAPQLSFVF
jgi:hypothetical protein